jgi:diguanylate cyclase (GGDEF)-like protein
MSVRTEPHGDDGLRPLSLTFEDAEIEKRFRASDWKGLLTFHRISYASGAILWALFAILDVVLARDDVTALWVIRFGIGWPTLLIAFTLTFVRVFQPRVQITGMVVAVVTAACIVAMVAVTAQPTSHLYYAGVSLVAVYVYTFGMIRFAHAILYGTGVIAAYETVALVAAHTPTELLINNTFFLLATVYGGVFVSYTMERYRRLNFLQRSQLAELTDQLEDLSVRDALTGLYNRRQLDQHLLEAMDQHRRHGIPAAAMLIDLDDFKAINDDYGHLAGDELLRRAADLIVATVRKTDLVFRYGGDEFFVLFGNTNLVEAELFASRLVERFEQHAVDSEHFATLCGVSIGVASIDDRTTSPENLLNATDRALYAAKQLGKGCVVVGGRG